MKKIKSDSFGGVTVGRMNMYWKLVKSKIKNKNKPAPKPKLFLLWTSGIKILGSKSTFETDDCF